MNLIARYTVVFLIWVSTIAVIVPGPLVTFYIYQNDTKDKVHHDGEKYFEIVHIHHTLELKAHLKELLGVQSCNHPLVVPLAGYFCCFYSCPHIQNFPFFLGMRAPPIV